MSELPLPVAGLAANQEMVFSSRLPEARHYIENLLAALCHWVAEENSRELDRLMKGVRLTGRSASGDGVQIPPAELCQAMSLGHRGLLLTTSNLQVHFDNGSVIYSCVVQLWDEPAGTSCVSRGTFRGRLEAGPQVWRWVDHEYSLTRPDGHGSAPLQSLDADTSSEDTFKRPLRGHPAAKALLDRHTGTPFGSIFTHKTGQIVDISPPAP